MLEDGILVAEQSVTQHLKWSCNLQHLTWARQVVRETQSGQSAGHFNPYIIVLSVFFKDSLVANKYPTLFHLIGAKRVAESQL